MPAILVLGKLSASVEFRASLEMYWREKNMITIYYMKQKCFEESKRKMKAVHVAVVERKPSIASDFLRS